MSNTGTLHVRKFKDGSIYDNTRYLQTLASFIAYPSPRLLLFPLPIAHEAFGFTTATRSCTDIICR